MRYSVYSVPPPCGTDSPPKKYPNVSLKGHIGLSIAECMAAMYGKVNFTIAAHCDHAQLWAVASVGRRAARPLSGLLTLSTLEPASE